MVKRNDPADTTVVRDVPPRKGVTVGKPRKIATGVMRSKMAFPSSGGSMAGYGGNWYSPELSTDFLELPQSIDEQRNYYRFFYDNDPFVGQALDLHTELPLSKLRLAKPKARDKEMGERAMRFCEKWAKKIHLLHRLIEILHELNLIGEAFIFCEDTNEDMPREIREEAIREILPDGEVREAWQEYPDADERAAKWLSKKYKGWTALRVLPPEQIKMESFPFTDEKILELVPDSKTRGVIEQARQGNPQAQRFMDSMPADIVDAIVEGRTLPLNTDPDAGSFCYYMARKKSQYEPHGKSVLQRCLLPGTPMWIDRGGVVQEIPVEEVDDKTDLLLTHKGRFRPCRAGSRPVNEPVVCLGIEDADKPLRLTADHEVLRIQEDGTEEWVEAGKLQVGDEVREGHVVPEADNWPRQIDLAAWWQKRSFNTVKRGRPNLNLLESSRQVDVTDVTVKANPGLAVSFSYENDNRNRDRAVQGLGQLLSWAQKLDAPVCRTQAEVALEAGVSERDVRVYAPRLRNEWLLHTEAVSLGRGRGREVTWFPTQSSLPQVQTTLTSPVTSIQVTEDFCYLLGTWLGDGCVWTNDNFLNTHSIDWSLHDNEPEVRKRVLDLIAKCFPQVTVLEGALIGDGFKEKGTQAARIEDPLLARWFMEEFGHTAQGKRLPRWVFDLPEEHLLALLRGLLDTDGCLTVDRASMIQVALDNPTLIRQIHLLCNRLKLKTQVCWEHKKARSWTRRWQTQSGWKEKTYQYEAKKFSKLNCCTHEDVKRWAVGSVKGDRVKWEDQNPVWKKKSNFKVGWLTHKIEQVSQISYTGSVFSFDVEEDESHATSKIVLHNCMRALVWKDKIRQSLTSIASRHMTPYRIIYAEDMNDEQTEALREQVDLALQDPDYSIITNFAVNWDERGADQRLPDWSWALEMVDRQLYAGLGVTESLLSGESTYSGDRLHLEVINTRYMLDREMLQDLVEEYFFKPMCKRMGFIEEDEDGDEVVIVPRLSFTRLALRDNADTFDALYNLYTKGSLDIDTVLDLLNLDPEAVQEKLKRDFASFNDASFNEVLRNIYTKVGDMLAENSDITERVAKTLGLTYTKPKEDAGRF